MKIKTNPLILFFLYIIIFDSLIEYYYSFFPSETVVETTIENIKPLQKIIDIKKSNHNRLTVTINFNEMFKHNQNIENGQKKDSSFILNNWAIGFNDIILSDQGEISAICELTNEKCGRINDSQTKESPILLNTKILKNNGDLDSNVGGFILFDLNLGKKNNLQINRLGIVKLSIPYSYFGENASISGTKTEFTNNNNKLFNIF